MNKINFKQKEVVVNGDYIIGNMNIQKSSFTDDCWMAFVYPTYAKSEEGKQAVINAGLIIDEKIDGGFSMRAKTPKMSYESFIEKAFMHYKKAFSEDKLINMIDSAIMQRAIFT